MDAHISLSPDQRIASTQSAPLEPFYGLQLNAPDGKDLWLIGDLLWRVNVSDNVVVNGWEVRITNIHHHHIVTYITTLSLTSMGHD